MLLLFLTAVNTKSCIIDICYRSSNINIFNTVIVIQYIHLCCCTATTKYQWYQKFVSLIFYVGFPSFWNYFLLYFKNQLKWFNFLSKQFNCLITRNFLFINMKYLFWKNKKKDFYINHVFNVFKFEFWINFWIRILIPLTHLQI